MIGEVLQVQQLERHAGATRVTDRVYLYWSDGAMKRYVSSVGTDPSRGAFFDGANRTTCAVNDSALSACPTPPSSQIVNTFAYDDADNRTSMRDSAGVTTYTLSGNALTGETPPGRTLLYQNGLAQGGPRLTDMETTAGYPTNARSYTYDGQGRVRQIDVRRAEGGTGVYRQHSITILYDHLGRPMYIADKNNTTLKERREQLYFDLAGNLINRQVTPDHTVSGTYTVDVFAHLEAGVVGQMAISYVGGTYNGETRSYVLRDPTGLAVARYSFTGTGATSLKWGAHYGPYGDLIGNTTGTAADASPFRFWGQYEIAGTQAERWNGSSVQQLRLPLVQNMWRVYDPRVGRYLTPDPLMMRASAPGWSPLYGYFRGVVHGFGYTLADPYNFGDFFGLESDDPLLNFLQNSGDLIAGASDWLTANTKAGDGTSLMQQVRILFAVEQYVNYDSPWYRSGHGDNEKPFAREVGVGLAIGYSLRGPAVCDGPSSRVLLRTRQQLQAKFKHAHEFGVPGNYSTANAAEFSRAMHGHINSPGVRTIQGTYHGQPMTHYVDPATGLNVMADPSGNFVSGWRLSPAQLQNVLTHGGL